MSQEFAHGPDNAYTGRGLGRVALVDGLGIEPGAALRELKQAILRQDPSLVVGTTEAGERSLLVLVQREAGSAISSS